MALIKSDLMEAQKILNDFISEEKNMKHISDTAERMIKSLKNGGKIISCGNGGSMCDAMHFAEEMTGRFRENRKPLAALSISDPSHLSCVANDYGFEMVFSRYVEAIGKKGDVLLAISTSGNSKNILAAIESAKKIGALAAGAAKGKGVGAVVFDRNGARYHGKVKALADAAREAGLKF